MQYRSLDHGVPQKIRVFFANSAARPAGLTGITALGAGSRLYKNDGTAVDVSTRTVTEIGGGWYDVLLRWSDADEPGNVTTHLEATGADPWDTNYYIDPYYRHKADALKETIYQSRVQPFRLYGDAPVIGEVDAAAGDHKCFGGVYYYGDMYHFFDCRYDTGTSYFSIYHDTSPDGLTWTLGTTPVITHGGAGDFDQRGCWSPTVVVDAGVAYMLYTGRGSVGGYTQIGLATADPADLDTWTKQGSVYAGGTLHEWDYRKPETGNLMKVGDTWYLHYGTLGQVNIPHYTIDLKNRLIGVATADSPAGPWTANPRNPIFRPPWDRRSGPFVLKSPTSGQGYYLFCFHYTADTDYTCIEMWRSNHPEFYPEDRDLARVVQVVGPQTWRDREASVVSIATSTPERNAFPDDEIKMYFTVEGYDGAIQTALAVVPDFHDALHVVPLVAGAGYPYSLSALATDSQGRVTGATKTVLDTFGNSVHQRTAAATYTGASRVPTTYEETDS